ncbi:uridine phosphorylase [Priestia taiwanensis]|uniref:Uridine phosphorylase n=1 Tax=Priestia taiwanensis TaxID=1347902 RepID=A0A917ENM0_9BACI|nr:uridine phosphorylase [Priestia taiwanensis]MBM7362578.1 hypothetical protein [Priestia taiwanensis]GGE63371.1 hypothetical protein GCM10007140_12040 [Priestia taiwanensis]
MKLYGDFTQQDWLRVFGVDAHEIPSSFIVHGEWKHEENLQLWSEVLKEEKWLPKWNTIVGSYQDRNVGFANVFIQTGYCGGLSFEVKYGDILIVKEAEMQDGVSHCYLPNKKRVKSDERVLRATIDYCEKKGYSYAVGSVLSTGALLVETEEMVRDWASNGHVGVDMETATTLAVAKKFVKRVRSAYPR